MPLNEGQVLQDRYRIDALLGQGGMGSVYRATDLRFDAPVAIKENRIATPESQKQFAREAGLLYRLRHPNLPRVIDHFFIAGQGQYLVMDYIEGEDLKEVLARRGPLPQAQALDWIARVLDALGYLHGRQIIHRDVKPANVKLTPRGEIYLVDFGLAKVYDPLQQTTRGARGVTPGFAPPEQYGQGRTDARTDVYSAAATLYALLTGRTPPDALEAVTGQARLDPPRGLNPAISPHVEAAILRAMQTRPDDRLQSAAALRAALLEPATRLYAEEAAEWEPGEAGPPAREVIPPVEGADLESRDGRTAGARSEEPGAQAGPEEPAAEARAMAEIAEMLHRARAARDAGDWSEAVALSAEAIALDTGAAEQAGARDLMQEARTAQQLARGYAQAREALEAGDLEAAVEALEGVVGLDAGYRDAGARLEGARAELARRQRVARLRAEGQAALDGGEWERAIDRSQALLELEPGDAAAEEGLSRAREEQEVDRQARAHYEEAVARFEGGAWGAAVEAADKAVALRPEVEAYAHLLAEARSRHDPEEEARRQAEEQARQEADRQKRLAEKFKQADRVAELYPWDAARLLAEIRREDRDYPGLDGVQRRVRQAQELREREARETRRRRILIAAGAIAAVAALALLVYTIQSAILSGRVKGRYEAAVAARAAGDAQAAEAELEAMLALQDDHPYYRGHLLKRYYRTVERAAGDGQWDIGAGIMGGIFKVNPTYRPEEIQALLVENAALRAACGARLGYWPLAWDEEEIRDLAFSPDGRYLATVNGYGSVRLWDAANGQLLPELEEGRLTGEYYRQYNAAFSPDGTLLAAGGPDDRVRVWRLETGRLLYSLEGYGSSRVFSVAFSPDGTLLAAGSSDNTVRVWQVSDGSLLHTLEGHEDDVVEVAFSADGATLVSRSEDDPLRLWRVDDGTLRKEVGGQKAFDLSPDGSLLATGREEGAVSLWAMPAGTRLSSAAEHERRVDGLLFSPDGATLVSLSDDGTVGLWRMPEGELRNRLDTDAAHAAFSPSGGTLATLWWHSNDVDLWRTADGAHEHTLGTEVGLAWSIRAYDIAYSPDGQSLAVAVQYYISGRESRPGGLVQLWQVPADP